MTPLGGGKPVYSGTLKTGHGRVDEALKRLANGGDLVLESGRKAEIVQARAAAPPPPAPFASRKDTGGRVPGRDTGRQTDA